MERIHVTVRSRPLPPDEAKNSPWKVSGNSIFTSNNYYKFEFDHIFGEDCRTREVYEARTRDIVSAAVRGFNGTVFAYGQTNSGKTHTMRGSDSEPGVIPLAVHDLFETIQQEVDREFLLRMSYMEIYNEDINDLLAPEHRKLQIHESIERGIFVAGLQEEIVASPQQVLDLMASGEAHRHIGETNMNLHSSRSHTIFRMIIESREKTEGEGGDACDAVRVSVLNLVDLAGSERAAKTGVEGVRLKEGSHINKSLMTLGTVIKKLSEGVESQGGHVPYRDSKLTRILQPALGGNANTAIICNVTLAQIHADETKSSLQFASRALRVTNCAHVNEILTDAALLKRQKKEIEELRAKLQGNHSEHLEEEILNLRNTLLQSELERERIALELEEEKKAQAERERVLQQQAKKIENLSSMVLLSNRDECRDYHKKEKRRDTWCPGNIPGVSPVESKSPGMKATRSERDLQLLLPFDELVNVTEEGDDLYKQHDNYMNTTMEDCSLPDPCTLMHVTNRRKLPPKPPEKKNSAVDENEDTKLLSEYEDLLLQFETQRTMYDIKIDYLSRKLSDAAAPLDGLKNKVHSHDHDEVNNYGDKTVGLQDLEPMLVIKQLQEKINILKMEKLSQQNMKSLAETVTEQHNCSWEKFEEGNDSNRELIKEAKDLISEANNCSETVRSVSSLFDEVIESFTSSVKDFHNFKILMTQNCAQQKSVIIDYDKLHHHMSRKISEAEDEKHLLHSRVIELQKQVHELGENAQSYKASLDILSEQNHLETSEYISYIQALEKELSCSSSASLLKEKESLIKDLDKTNKKLKDTEAKLKNVMQQKTKVEGEKVFAEKEVKRLLAQQNLLERDTNKRDSLAATRRESTIDRSNVFDVRKAKVLEQSMKEDHQKLELITFEMETIIVSLEDKLAAVEKEKEAVISVNENLSSELEALTKKVDVSKSELNFLEEEILNLKLKLEQSSSNQVEAERTINRLVEEKEELAMQLCNSLLEMEEERAIWRSKEKASIEAINDAEIKSLSQGRLQVKEELDLYKEACQVLRESLASYNAMQNEEHSIQKLLMLDQSKDEEAAAAGSCKTHVNFDSGVLSPELVQAQEKLSSLQLELSITKREREDLQSRIRQLDERPNLSDEIQNLRVQLQQISREKQALLTQMEELHHSSLEIGVRENNDELSRAKSQIDELQESLCSTELKMHQVEVNNGKEKAKLRMRLRGTQAELEIFKYRHKQMVAELDTMNTKFQEASANLKKRLASKAIEVLNLKKELAAVKGG